MLGFSKRQREPDELTGDDKNGSRGNKVCIFSDRYHRVEARPICCLPIRVALFIACKSSNLQLLIAARPETTPSTLAYLTR